VDKFSDALSSLRSVAKKSVIAVRGSEVRLGLSRISTSPGESVLRLSLRGPAGVVELERSHDLDRWEVFDYIQLDRFGARK
jgi:hypothetical protein